MAFKMSIRVLLRCLVLLFMCGGAYGQAPDSVTRKLGAEDVIKINVFQNPDLNLETRISEGGRISYPLVGSVEVGGLTVAEAEQRIATRLSEGGFVRKPQVSIIVVQLRSAQVSVLGQVGHPGRYPIETVNSRVSEMIAVAGGVNSSAADVVMLIGQRDGKTVRIPVDLPAILQGGEGGGEDPVVTGGDTLFVDRAPVVYIYGEVQRPGVFRLERGMTLMQGLVQGGGLTSRGTERWIKINRRDAAGRLTVVEPTLADLLQRDDVIFVRESFF